MGGEERVIGEGMRVIFVVIKKKKKNWPSWPHLVHREHISCLLHRTV